MSPWFWKKPHLIALVTSSLVLITFSACNNRLGGQVQRGGGSNNPNKPVRFVFEAPLQVAPGSCSPVIAKALNTAGDEVDMLVDTAVSVECTGNGSIKLTSACTGSNVTSVAMESEDSRFTRYFAGSAAGTVVCTASNDSFTDPVAGSFTVVVQGTGGGTGSNGGGSPSADITIAPQSGTSNFGEVSVGQSLAKVFVVTNLGPNSALMGMPVVTGLGFSIVNPGVDQTCSTNTLTVNQTCTVRVTFTPTQGGVVSGSNVKLRVPFSVSIESVEYEDLLISGTGVQDRVYGWNFRYASEYSYDHARLEVENDVARLIPTYGQVYSAESDFDRGSYADLRYNGMGLEVDGAPRTGYWSSPIMEADSALARWQTLKWITDQPYRALPDNRQNESGYAGGMATYMANNIALYHFDGTAYPDADDDDSGQNHTLTFSATSPEINQPGRFREGVRFSSTNHFADSTAYFPSGNPSVTYSVWIKADSHVDNMYIIDRTSASTPLFSLYVNKLNATTSEFRLQARKDSGTTNPVVEAVGGRLAPGVWQNIVIVRNVSSGQVLLYVDGVLAQSKAFGGQMRPPAVRLGRHATNTAARFIGYMDEFAAFDTALTSDQITALYRRGMSRVMFQARSCNNSSCSTASFVGPDGTSATWFSELQNPSTAAPEISLGSTFRANYFQVRARLEAETAVGPELQLVKVGPPHYRAATVKNVSTDAYSRVNSIALSYGQGHTGLVKIRLSPNGSQWFYVNANGQWAPSGDPDQSSTEAAVNAALPNYASTVGTGFLYFQLVLYPGDENDLRPIVDHVTITFR